MARRRASNRGRSKIQPAVTDLQYKIPAAGGLDTDSRSYVDTMRDLSRINRRLYSQSRMVAYQGLTYIWKAAASYDVAPGDTRTLSSIECTVRTAGNTWVVQNSHVKAHALWNEMQDLVLDDNPSVAGKWRDFKVRLVKTMAFNRIIDPLSGDGIPVLPGEWSYSTFVLPQHEVDPVTGEPLPAHEVTAVLIGADGTAAGIVDKVSLVKAYQDSRATVQNVDPNVPAALSTSFFTQLTDTGSQEPELADVIEDENDQPPYDTDNYPGGDTNAVTPVTVGYGAISNAEVDGRIGAFIAPCGLIEIEIIGFDQLGIQFPVANMPAVDILLHVAPGMYKGIASVSMGQ